MRGVVFRQLQRGDAAGLDEAQRIMARESYAFAFDHVPGQDFGAYLELMKNRRAGQQLRAGGVPSTFEVGLVGDRIAARLSVRHALNDFLLEQGGHIGYAVLPEFRGRGLGFASLQRGLELTASLCIAATLVTCDDDNPASRHIIETAGGQYESSHVDVGGSVPVRRYWFATGRDS